ncbi:Stabilin-1 [Exaiptasia diaphana]|nr:Stabilin-1 [Exaiptasia diaphana]
MKNKVSGFKVYSGVFHLRIWYVPYMWNYIDAKRVCEMFGADLANLQQLTAAWKIGYDICSWGWLVDGTVRYPIFYKRNHNNCGYQGLVRIWGDTTVQDKVNRKAGAYCYKESEKTKEIHRFRPKHILQCIAYTVHDVKASETGATRRAGTNMTKNATSSSWIPRLPGMMQIAHAHKREVCSV